MVKLVVKLLAGAGIAFSMNYRVAQLHNHKCASWVLVRLQRGQVCFSVFMRTQNPLSVHESNGHDH